MVSSLQSNRTEPPIPTPVQTFRPTFSPPSKKPTVAPSVQKTPTSSPAPSTNLRYCGLSLGDAQNRCVKATPCPDGRNDNWSLEYQRPKGINYPYHFKCNKNLLVILEWTNTILIVPTILLGVIKCKFELG